MHNLLARGNALFAFSLWVLTAVTFFAYLSVSFRDPSALVRIETNNARVRSVVDYTSDEERSDLVQFDASITVDLTSVFNWNVKQIFLYLVAEYATDRNPVNQFVVWDRIVLRGQRVVVDEHRIVPKYYFLDDGSHLRGHQNITLVLRWNVVPNAGYLGLAQGQGQHVVKIPSEYSTSKH